MALEDAILKFVPAGVESVEKGFVSGWASAPVIDRSRDLILGTAVDTTFYRPNPVVLWCHNRTGLPIGRSETPNGGFGLKTKLFQSNGLDGLWHDTRFNLDDEFAAKVYGCYQSGFLKGWSMGFIPTAPITRVPHEITKRLNDTALAKFFPSVKLFEYSAVPIPDNQLALSDARFKALHVPADLMPLVERWTPSQATFAARYPGTMQTIRETVDIDPATLPEFPAPAPQSPASREVSKMDELVPLTPAPVEKAVAPDPIQELRDRIDAMPALIEKSIQSAVSDAVGAFSKIQHETAAALEVNIREATELQLETMGKLARVK